MDDGRAGTDTVVELRRASVASCRSEVALDKNTQERVLFLF